jgi:hypothetical protein
VSLPPAGPTGWLPRFSVVSAKKTLDVSRITSDSPTVTGRERKAGHGGARRGAGRKRIVQEPERIAVDVEKPDLDALRELAERRGTSVADLIRRAVAQYLRRAGRS